MAVKPHKAALANLLHMPLTVAGVACTDFAAFHIPTGGDPDNRRVAHRA